MLLFGRIDERQTDRQIRSLRNLVNEILVGILICFDLFRFGFGLSILVNLKPVEAPFILLALLSAYACRGTM